MNKRHPFIVVIPARMKSSRLAGKPLIDLCGKSLIQRTWEQTVKSVPRDKVFVATDHNEIKQHCERLRIQTVMTSAGCLTGTDRVAEVAKQINADYYINVQGDEPLINPQDVTDTILATTKFSGEIINGYAKVDDKAQYNSRNIPKVVYRPDGRLLYMSRSPIPGNKNDLFQKAWRQICVYAFPQNPLLDFAAKQEKSTLEKQEDIELLRFLEMGYDVRMIPLSNDSIAVDTPEDAQRVREVLKTNRKRLK